MDFDELIDEFDSEPVEDTNQQKKTSAFNILKMKKPAPTLPAKKTTGFRTSYPKLPEPTAKPTIKSAAKPADNPPKAERLSNPSPHGERKEQKARDLLKRISFKRKPSKTAIKRSSKESELEAKWLGLLAHVEGLSQQDKSRYAALFAVAGINEELATKLNDKTLEVMGVKAAEHRAAILKGIQDEMAAAGMEDEDYSVGLAAMWYSLLLKEGFSIHDAKRYAKGFEEHGIDEAAAIELDDEQLEEGGIADAHHRELILNMIDRIVGEHEQAKVNIKDIDWEKLQQEENEQVKAELEESIRHYNQFQSNLAQILAGDTPRQRQARAQRREERRKRDIARRKRRADRALKHGRDVYDHANQNV